ncbi:uncharacterized protein LOC105228216 isoform X3 [Bactrocera dorsalis]|uniref:Uncharacterized protein LOC105228216 isoform X3 n=1 Tax=Bactrocera dorsalis TaxID=27457 RepID=A0ABM3J9F9_BACDO|nr:uncharacterized protein LOC105228216 isoform X3 [Bactrocera dorsalis]
MHRLPLILSTPSVYWDRDAPEYALFENAMNESNINETESFLSILDEAEKLAISRKKIFQSQLEGAHRLVNSDQLVEGAINDFEMFLHSSKKRNDHSQLCEIHGSITIACYMMRFYDKAKRHLRSYNKYKAKLSQECVNNNILETINAHIFRFECELDDYNKVESKSDTTSQEIPHLGFNEGKEIKPIPSACTYINIDHKQSKFSGVFPKVDLPKASAIFLEKPLSTGLNVPLIQCELCLHRSDQVYTCFNCRYKTYCSFDCIEKDQKIHQYECSAYRSLLIYILDAQNLYRLFIKVSMHLDEHIFSKKLFRKLMSAEDILKNIEESVDIENSEFGFLMNLLRVKPNYNKLHNMQYSTLVVTAFRLTMFIFRKANLILRFYKKLRTPDTHKMVLVGVILMRLFCHLLLNTFDFEYLISLVGKKQTYKTVYDEIAEWTKLITPVRPEDSENKLECYNLTKAEILESSTRNLEISEEQEKYMSNFTPLKHTQLCNPIERPLSIFKDKLVELYFSPSDTQFIMYGYMAEITTSHKAMSASIAKMPSMERLKFVRSFVINFHTHFLNYFLRLGVSFSHVRQILSQHCPTLRKFKHSCDPNVKVVVLDNGMLMGIALRDIKKGEELVVSFKANCIRHTRTERTTFLKHINIQCQCKACQIPVEKELINIRQGIYCDVCCGHIITASEVKCSQCGKNFNILLLKYRKEVTMMENNIARLTNPETDKRKLYLVNTVLYLRMKNNFVPSNEIRIQVELRYARYLALKNFAEKSYQVLCEINRNIAQYYNEDILWFSFYSDMLLVIKIIMYYNVDEKLNPISLYCLLELCEFALYILNGQHENLCLLKIDTLVHTEIYDEIKIFKKWKVTLQYTASIINVVPISEENKDLADDAENLSHLNKSSDN